MNVDGLDFSILGPAFLAGLLVLSTHVPLGRQVLARGIIFIDLAIAQIAGLGVMAAHAFHWSESPWATQLVAFSAAISGALFLYICEKRWPDIQEAIIGTVFILAASGGILLLAGSPHAGDHLKDLLVGQILWVDYQVLPAIAALYALVLLAWFRLHHEGRQLLFYLLFAVTVTVSVQLVGVYLVFASLIIPALAVRSTGIYALWLGYGVGIGGYALGLTGSALYDLPAGPLIVIMLAVLGLVFQVARKSSNRPGR
jgi:zinc/manganese transport system permease protein